MTRLLPVIFNYPFIIASVGYFSAFVQISLLTRRLRHLESRDPPNDSLI